MIAEHQIPRPLPASFFKGAKTTVRKPFPGCPFSSLFIHIQPMSDSVRCRIVAQSAAMDPSGSEGRSTGENVIVERPSRTSLTTAVLPYSENVQIALFPIVPRVPAPLNLMGSLRGDAAWKCASHFHERVSFVPPDRGSLYRFPLWRRF